MLAIVLLLAVLILLVIFYRSQSSSSSYGTEEEYDDSKDMEEYGRAMNLPTYMSMLLRMEVGDTYKFRYLGREGRGQYYGELGLAAMRPGDQGLYYIYVQDLFVRPKPFHSWGEFSSYLDHYIRTKTFRFESQVADTKGYVLITNTQSLPGSGPVQIMPLTGAGGRDLVPEGEMIKDPKEEVLEGYPLMMGSWEGMSADEIDKQTIAQKYNPGNIAQQIVNARIK